MKSLLPDDINDVDLDAAIADADPIALRAALWIQTHDTELEQMPVHRPGRLNTHIVPPLELVDVDDVERVRTRARSLIGAIGAGDLEPRRASVDDIPTVIRMLTGDTPPDETLDFWCEEFPIESGVRRPDPIDGADVAATFPDLEVIVIGAGMGGISAAVMLQDAGIPFTIIEKNASVGGTWYTNTYPGIRVDLPSRAYSFTFESDYVWKSYYAPGAELLEYLNYTVDKRGIRDHITFDTEALELTWDEGVKCWRVCTREPDGSVTERHANFVISAVGLFNRPLHVDFEGLDSFEGSAMHTTAWDHSVEVEGARVGVVGTGSSGIQVVRPLADVARHLTVFQRSASWIGHLANYTSEIPATERWMIARFPSYVNCVRMMQIYSIGDSDSRYDIHDVDPNWPDPHSVSAKNAMVREQMLEYIEGQLAGRPDLIERTTPNYPPMSKRVPKDNGWYSAIRESHVDLETRPIRRIVPNGVEVESGEVIELDVLVLATGFRTDQFLWPMKVTGVGGQTLEDFWQRDGARAHFGITVTGFPNLFCIYGPNTNPTSGGPCMWGELQARFAVESIGALARVGKRSMDVKADVFHEFNRALDEQLANKIWLDARQRSYFVNEHGRIVTNAPWQTRQYWKWTRRPVLDDYDVK